MKIPLRKTVYVRDLLPGDVIQAGNGQLPAVQAVDCLGAVTIVEFVDGTASAPIGTLQQVTIDRMTVRLATDRPVHVHSVWCECYVGNVATISDVRHGDRDGEEILATVLVTGINALEAYDIARATNSANGCEKHFTFSR